MLKYPYPVLTDEGSSYLEDIKFTIAYVKNCIALDHITLEFDIEMNSNVLKALIDSGDAKMIIKAQTGIFSTSFNVDVVEGKFSCKLNTSDIPVNDTLKFVGYIITNKQITYTHNQELDKIYDSKYKLTLNKNSVLAVSNTESLTYISSNNDFIKFKVSDEQNGKGFKINYGTNHIEVIVGPDFNEAYGIVKNNKKELCSIFNNQLVFEVMIYALIDLIQDYDGNCESEWYKLFEQIFLQCGEYESFEEFIGVARDENNNYIDMEAVFDMAHKMINNQIENSMIALSKKEEIQ